MDGAQQETGHPARARGKTGVALHIREGREDGGRLTGGLGLAARGGAASAPPLLTRLGGLHRDLAADDGRGRGVAASCRAAPRARTRAFSNSLRCMYSVLRYCFRCQKRPGWERQALQHPASRVAPRAARTCLHCPGIGQAAGRGGGGGRRMQLWGSAAAPRALGIWRVR